MEENIGGYLHKLELGTFNKRKSTQCKGNTDNFDYIKIKNFCLLYDSMKRYRDKPQSKWWYLQTDNSRSQYAVNSMRSTVQWEVQVKTKTTIHFFKIGEEFTVSQKWKFKSPISILIFLKGTQHHGQLEWMKIKTMN